MTVHHAKLKSKIMMIVFVVINVINGSNFIAANSVNLLFQSIVRKVPLSGYVRLALTTSATSVKLFLDMVSPFVVIIAIDGFTLNAQD